jgi:hypothetical protein
LERSERENGPLAAGCESGIRQERRRADHIGVEVEDFNSSRSQVALLGDVKAIEIAGRGGGENSIA